MDTTISVLAQAETAFRSGLVGDFSGWSSVRSALRRDPTPTGEAWSLALCALAYFADVEGARLPTLDALGHFARSDVETREVVSLACGLAERAAVLGFSRVGLHDYMELHARLLPEDAGESRMWLAAARCWHAIMAGRLDNVEAQAAELGGQARAAGLPALTIEAMSLRALSAACRRDLEEATKLARRASRMARTEAMPQQEYLANLTLARVRRLAGQPHLAARILNALVSVAPTPWRPWLTWELLLAQGAERTEEAPMPRGRAGRSVNGLRALLSSARAGDRVTFESAFGVASEATSDFVELNRELERLVVLMDPQHEGDRFLEPWLGGQTHQTPDGLHGICGVDGAQGSLEGDVAHVFVGAGAPGRRVLSPGTCLVDPVTKRLPLQKRPQLRTDATLAVLALVGPDGMEEDVLFQEVYGFGFEPALHRAVLNTLNTRMRARVADAGALEREGGRIAVVPLCPFTVPDPRCSPPPEHTLLAVLGKLKHMSAAQAAEMLGVPLRTVQRALAELAEDGACRAVKVGRGLEYVLDDTTFSEPTTHV